MKRFTVLFGLAGCAGGGNDDGMEAATAADIEEVQRAVGAGTTGLDPAVELDRQGAFAGVGDCVWGFTVAGPADGAALDAAIDGVPCGGSVAGERGSVEYAVTAAELGGGISFAGDGAWDYDLTGTRTADTTVTSTARGTTRTYTGQWELVSLVGRTDADGTGPFDAVLTYTGWFGGDWGLEWSRTADGAVSGALVGPRGASCTVSGVDDAVEVSCD
ncbi:MAG: hypothetical protein ABMA64_33870 [Myxococcota bacterium]